MVKASRSKPVDSKSVWELTYYIIVNGTVWSSSNKTDTVTISVVDDSGKVIASHKATANENFEFSVDGPKLWSPSDPNLYNLTVTLGDDEITSYTLVPRFIDIYYPLG